MKKPIKPVNCKVIWAMWLQGVLNAPYIVQRCLKSWEEKNLSWQLIVLDEKNVSEYLDLNDITKKNSDLISKQAFSDIVRINLLNKYGGVWVDATCLCLKPLDDWIYSYLQDGFFAFDRPGIDRPIASWFLASASDCYLTNKYCEEVNHYWTARRFSNQDNAIGRWINSKIQSRMQHIPCDSQEFTLLFNLTKWARFCPYYWFHYLFSQILNTDKACYEAWNRTMKLSADIPHKAQRIGLSNLMDDSIKEQLDILAAPLYKLTWRIQDAAYDRGTVLNYILNKQN